MVPPALGRTPESISAYCEAVAQAVAAGDLSPAQADKMIAGARVAAMALRRTEEAAEVAELRRILAEARELARANGDLAEQVAPGDRDPPRCVCFSLIDPKTRKVTGCGHCAV